MPTPAILSCRDVVKRLGDVVAIDGLSLDVLEGRTTVLIGPSGSGKSTLLRLLGGLLSPDAGRVLFQGAEVTPTNAALLRRHIGLVLQEGGLFPHLTAERNITLVARHRRWPAQRIAARLEELARLVSLPRDVLDRPPGDLSGGQRQRVALLRALMTDPEILLLDEPLGALDPIVRRDLQDDLRALFRALGKTVVLVTHDLGEAAFFADEVVLLRAGRIVQRGAVVDLLENPADAFVERFVRAQRPLLPEARS